MKRKPEGPKYCNLSARSGAIYYERVCQPVKHHAAAGGERSSPRAGGTRP
jgi:hypothetical protein